ncbi:MAG: hypothetical protein WAU92_10725, partial [Candidatus Sulfotelmatobacter sp.]
AVPSRKRADGRREKAGGEFSGSGQGPVISRQLSGSQPRTPSLGKSTKSLMTRNSNFLLLSTVH